jgi:molybdopterin/thiamine biosynthesis adenylyltransferase
MPDMVTIFVDGRPIQVPIRTSASEIRRMAHSDQSRPIAKASGSRNVVVSGELDVSEGDRFVIGRPFTKGMQKFKVLSSKKQRKADKSIRLLFPQPLYERMRDAFAGSEALSRESYAMAQCGSRTDGSRKNRDYFVRSLHVPSKEDLFEQSSITVTPRAEFIEAILSQASEKNCTVVEIHTHVGSPEPNFSWIDIENGLENGRFLKSCGLRFAMAVIGSNGFSFCEYDGDRDALQMPESARVGTIGRNGLRDALIHKSCSSCEITSKARPEGMRVAIAGLEGAGFGIVSMLARQGVKHFTLLDDGMLEDNSPDAVPDTAGSGKKRTKVARNMLKNISKDIYVSYVNDISTGARAALKECDLIFSCERDGALSAAVSEASLKYFIPCIEAHSLEKDGSPYGIVMVLMPSVTGCSSCFKVPAPARAETPSSVVINDMVASIAVQEFMDILSGVEKDYDLVEYDPATGSLERKPYGRDETCPMCGRDGILGAGDERKARK